MNVTRSAGVFLIAGIPVHAAEKHFTAVGFLINVHTDGLALPGSIVSSEALKKLSAASGIILVGQVVEREIVRCDVLVAAV